MSELRPEVERFAQLINDQLDAQEAGAAEHYPNYLTMSPPRIVDDFSRAVGLIEEWFDGYRNPWKSPHILDYWQTMRIDLQWTAMLLFALGQTVGLLGEPPPEPEPTPVDQAKFDAVVSVDGDGVVEAAR